MIKGQSCLQVMWLQKSGDNYPVKVLTTDTTSQEPQKYSVFKPTSISWRLRIQNIEEGDEGLYLCRVETQPKTYISKSRFVKVVGMYIMDQCLRSISWILFEPCALLCGVSELDYLLTVSCYLCLFQ